MHAAVMLGPGQELLFKEMPVADLAADQVLVKVTACGVCRTDLHVLDSELPDIKYPLIPGHEVVGIVERFGNEVRHLTVGQRVVVPWLAKTCGSCTYCCNNMENLCSMPLFTGYTSDGGFAEYMLAYGDYCFPAPAQYLDIELAPLICAGLIGWRSYKFTDCKNSINKRLGIYGFGAAAHIIAQVAIYDKLDVYAFTRAGDHNAQDFALSLGVKWAGSSEEPPPEELDAAIIFAPVGSLVKQALKAVRKGGIVVCGGIHMSDIPSFPYELLWGERKIVSVANLTRQDAVEFLEIAPKIPIRTKVHEYKLEDAQQALTDLRKGAFTGAAVLVP